MTAHVRTTSASPAPVEQVFAVLTSEAWAAVKADRLRDGSKVERRDEEADGAVVFAVSRALPDGVPGFLQRFLPADGRVLQTDEWDAADAAGARRGRWQVVVPGAPARLGGTMRLEPTASGSTYTIEGDCTVSVPLIGSNAETFIAGLVDKLAGKEAVLLAEQVSG